MRQQTIFQLTQLFAQLPVTAKVPVFGEPLVSSLFLVVQWDLVCDRAHLKDLTQAIFVVGVMIGAMICTILADKFGRKPVFLLSHWAAVVVGVANAFAPNYYVFAACKLFDGVLYAVRPLFPEVLFLKLNRSSLNRHFIYTNQAK